MSINTVGLAAGSAGAALSYLTNVFNAKNLGRRTPATRSAGAGADTLYDAYEKRVADIGSGRKAKQVDLDDTRGVLESFNSFDPRDNMQLTDFASNTTNNPATGNPGVVINPNADEAYLAHELGHIASTHTDVGSLVRSLSDNPKLKKALMASMLTLPGVAAAFEAGDNDMDSSLALATLAASPTLVDEALASKNGLAILENAGRRATLGQRGKLAGGYLSYVAPVLMAGVGGNIVGNLVDRNEPM